MCQDAFMTIWADWCCSRGVSWVFPPPPQVYLCQTHTRSLNAHLHLSYPWYKIGFKAFEIRVFFFSPKSFIPLFSFFPSTLLLLLFTSGGFCVVNGGESWRDEKGRDATLGKLSVKDRGRDGWRGWVHERMTEGRKESWAKTKYVEQWDTGKKNKEWSDQ